MAGAAARIAAALLVASVLAIIDGPPWDATPMLAGGILVALSPLILADLVAATIARRWQLPLNWFRGAFVLISSVPLGWGAYLSLIGEGITSGVAFAALSLLAMVATAVVAGHFTPARVRLPIIVALGQLVFLFFEAHLAENTLTIVREGTETVRLAAFFGIWLASAPLAIAWGFRIYDTAGGSEEESGREKAFAWAMRLAALGAGIGLLVGDRFVFEGLYPGFHTWMLFAGFVSVEVALIIVLRRAATLARKPALAAAVLVALGLCSLPFISPIASDPFYRAALDTKRLASLTLRFQEARNVAAGAEVYDHPLLDFPTYHDYQHDLPQHNLVLVSIDTLRSDWVGPSSVKPGLTPAFDALAEDSMWFDLAYAPGPRTAIGMGCLLLGQYSANLEWNLWIWRHGTIYDPAELSPEKKKSFGDNWGYTTIPTFPEQGTIAERIQRSGYYTMAIPFAGKITFFNEGVGFERGFDIYDNLTGKLRGKPTSSRVIERAAVQWGKAPQGKPWFQWIHLFDPHETNAKPKQYEEMVAATDKAIGELVTALKAQGLWENTVLAIVADHGEAMGEHGYRFHGHSLYDEQVRVPMAVRIPDTPARRQRQPASTLDAVATFLAVAGADATDIDGVNLVPYALDGEYPEERPVFTEMHRYRGNSGKLNRDAKAIVVGEWKLIYNRKKNWVKLFNLTRDRSSLISPGIPGRRRTSPTNTRRLRGA